MAVSAQARALRGSRERIFQESREQRATTVSYSIAVFPIQAREWTERQSGREKLSAGMQE